MRKAVCSLPEHHIAFVEAYAARYECSRSEALRRILDLFIDASTQPESKGSAA